MEVVVTPGAKKIIKRLSKVPQIAVIEKLQRLQSTNIINAIKLTGYKGVFRVRVGNYRIIYRIMNKKIYVVLIGHRKEIYRLLDRFMK